MYMLFLTYTSCLISHTPSKGCSYAAALVGALAGDYIPPAGRTDAHDGSLDSDSGR